MGADILLAEARDLLVESWSVVDGQLRLRFRGGAEERTLRCACGRCHWILETRAREDGAVLAVRCHNCGTAKELVLPGFHVPSR